MKKENNINIVIINQINIIKEYKDIKDIIFNKLKQLSKELNIIIIVIDILTFEND